MDNVVAEGSLAASRLAVVAERYSDRTEIGSNSCVKTSQREPGWRRRCQVCRPDDSTSVSAIGR